MSSSVDPSNPASPVGEKPVELPDVTLRSGDLLSLEETSELARTMTTTLVTLVGPPGAGKSTLLATVHECFRQNRFQRLSFSGSHTLVAFEELCHLSRIASGLTEPETQRSKFQEEERFYHLIVSRPEKPTLSSTLFVMDVAGEGFDGLRKSHDNCLAITSFKRTKFLTLLIDGEKLGIAKERFSVIEDAVNFLKCVWDSASVKSNCRLQVVVTKVDRLQDEDAKTAIDTMKATIERRIDRRFPLRSFLEVAARPKGCKGIRAAHGLEALVETWVIPPNGRSQIADDSERVTLNEERESEAFQRRHFASDPK